MRIYHFAFNIFNKDEVLNSNPMLYCFVATDREERLANWNWFKRHLYEHFAIFKQSHEIDDNDLTYYLTLSIIDVDKIRYRMFQITYEDLERSIEIIDG